MVTLSPVCTPIGSRFSIEQMTTKLSFASRMTSSSYSFQPSTDSSIKDLAAHAGSASACLTMVLVLVAVVGDTRRPRTSEGEARTNDRREADPARAPSHPSSMEWHVDGCVGTSSPIESIAALKLVAVLGLLDHLEVEHRAARRRAARGSPLLAGLDGQVERGLAPDRGAGSHRASRTWRARDPGSSGVSGLDVGLDPPARDRS